MHRYKSSEVEDSETFLKLQNTRAHSASKAMFKPDTGYLYGDSLALCHSRLESA